MSSFYVRLLTLTYGESLKHIDYLPFATSHLHKDKFFIFQKSLKNNRDGKYKKKLLDIMHFLKITN